MPESLHRFSRTELLLGDEKLAFLNDSKVIILGIGGVGSYAAEALCRAGIGDITIVDFDDICLTNINRQIHAMSSTAGKSKVTIMAERMKDINPEARITALKSFYSQENSDSILLAGYDYALDCIDHFTSKVHLLSKCLEMNLPVISSMGAAGKLDPSKIHVTDISKTSVCRMAKTVRKLLREKGISKGIKVVFSDEETLPAPKVSNICAQGCICSNKDDSTFSCRHRRVILGSISYIPAIFGMTMAGKVVCDLLEHHETYTDSIKN